MRVDTHLAEGVSADQVDRWVPTASILHPNGDAMDIAVSGDRIVGFVVVRSIGSITVVLAPRTCSAGRRMPRWTA
jgi:hypothetical protein